MYKPTAPPQVEWLHTVQLLQCFLALWKCDRLILGQRTLAAHHNPTQQS